MAKEIVFPEVIEEPVLWGPDKDLHRAAGYKALVDADTGKLFTIVSQDYKVIRHERAIEQVEEAIAEAHDLGEHTVVTEFFNEGGRMRRKYVFSEVSVDIQRGDDVNLELQLLNSYDVTWPFVVLLGAFRLVCSNGLVVGKKFLYLRKRHIYGLDQIGLQQEISSAIKRFYLQTRQWRMWAGRQLTIKTHDQVMEAMKFGKAAMQEINKRIEQEAKGFDESGFPIMSLWIFFNVLTWYITYRAVSLNHRVAMERRLRNAMASLKRK